MVKPSLGMLARAGSLAALVISTFSLQAHALGFSVDALNCTELDWSASLTQTEWSVASYINLFFVSTEGARNYSLLYSALNGGDFSTPGNYRKVTPFGDTALSGTYRIGIGLADINGNILTTLSTSSGIVQVTAIDSRTFTFTDCGRNGTAPASASTTSASISPTAASTSASFATTAASATSQSTQAVASSTSVAAAPVSSLAPATTTATTPVHHVNKGAIAGGVIGGLVLLLIGVALMRWCASRRRTRRLSMAAHRMSALRSPSLSEKAAGSPKDDGSVSPHSQRRMTARVYPSGDTLDVAALGRLSSSSRRRSASNGDDLSLSNILAQGPPHVPETEAEPEIRVIKVPFNLTPGQQMAPAHESIALDASPFADSDTPYLPLSRTKSVPVHPHALNPFYSAHPAKASAEAVEESSLHARSKSTPVVDPLANSTTPTTSPTASSFPNRTLRGAHSQNFKIPRVSVPAYLAGIESGADDLGAESMSRQISCDSGMRRFSTGAATFVSVDEDPFVDAAQEPAPSASHAA